MSKAQEDYDNFVSEYFKKGALRTMSIDEREAILDGKLIFFICFYLSNIKKLRPEKELG
jgi:hypothetical protein